MLNSASEKDKPSIQEAITFVQSHKGKLGPLNWNDCLSKSASDHVSDIGEKGLISHQGSDGTSFKDRVERYALWGGALYETILYQVAHTPALHISAEWLVDDGPTKANRKNLMADHHKEIGIAIGPHSHEDVNFSTVIKLAG